MEVLGFHSKCSQLLQTKLLLQLLPEIFELEKFSTLGERQKFSKTKEVFKIKMSDSDPCFSWTLWRYLIRREVGDLMKYSEPKGTENIRPSAGRRCGNVHANMWTQLVQERHEDLLYGKVNEAQNNEKKGKEYCTEVRDHCLKRNHREAKTPKVL